MSDLAPHDPPVEGITVPGTGHVPVSCQQLASGAFRISVGSESAILSADDGRDLGRVLLFDKPDTRPAPTTIPG